MARSAVDLFEVERVERAAPPPHPSPLRGEGVGGGVGLPASDGRRERADWVRSNLPICSEFAALVRETFGDCRMIYAEEAGHVIGKPTPAPGFSVSGEALVMHLPMVKKGSK